MNIILSCLANVCLWFISFTFLSVGVLFSGYLVLRVYQQNSFGLKIVYVNISSWCSLHY